LEQIGCLCKGKSSGRPRVSEENVRRIQDSFERSPRKSTRRASRELGIPQPTVWRVLRRRLLFNLVHLSIFFNHPVQWLVYGQGRWQTGRMLTTPPCDRATSPVRKYTPTLGSSLLPAKGRRTLSRTMTLFKSQTEQYPQTSVEVNWWGYSSTDFCGARAHLKPRTPCLRFLGYTQKHTHPVALFWMNDQPVTEVATYATHKAGNV